MKIYIGAKYKVWLGNKTIAVQVTEIDGEYVWMQELTGTKVPPPNLLMVIEALKRRINKARAMDTILGRILWS